MKRGNLIGQLLKDMSLTEEGYVPFLETEKCSLVLSGPKHTIVTKYIGNYKFL